MTEKKKSIRFEKLKLDLAAYECQVNGRPIPTTPLEFNLIRFFIENKERMLTREEILKSVWNDIVVNERCVDTQIHSIRKKLKESGLEIVSRYSLGYSLRRKRVGKTQDDCAPSIHDGQPEISAGSA